MSGVRLDRVARACPACQAPRRVWTHPRAGTRAVASCSPYRCRIARTFALAAGPYPASYEPAPLQPEGHAA